MSTQYLKCRACGEMMTDEQMAKACDAYLELQSAAWTAAMAAKVERGIELYKVCDPNQLDSAFDKIRALQRDLEAARAKIADLSLPWWRRW